MIKHLFKQTTLILILLFSLFVVKAQNQRLVLGDSNTQAHQATLLSDGPKSLSIKFDLNELILNEVITSFGKEYTISSPKAPNFLEEGVPDIFYLTRSFIIPDKGMMEIEVIPGKFEEIKGINIAPSKGNLTRNIDPSTVEFVKGDVYGKDSFFPENQAELRDPYILRDFRGQTLDVFPVQYNPVTKTLRIYHEVTIVLKHKEIASKNEYKRQNTDLLVEKEFSAIYENMFINYSKAKYTVVEEEGELLIIAYDDFVESMKPFVNWKRTIGRKTTIVPKSQVGSSSNDIKSYIANFYNNPSNNLSHVLLVGDAPQIPPVEVDGSGHSDNAYGYIVGNDSYNEIFVGRFSAENITHVQTQVQKVIEYERDLSETDLWLNLGLGVARNEGAGNGHFGEADYQHINYIRDTLLNYNYETIYQEYDGNVPGITNTTAAQISSRINDGVGIINYCNHGSLTGWSVANYSISNVLALTNTGKLPFIWAVACVNGDFANNLCFAEAWLRATHNGEPSGAIGTMMSSINQAWQPPMTGQDEMVGILSESFANNIKRTFGGVSINGSMKMLDIYGSSGKETHDTWVLFGDPTLQLRTDVPTQMEVSYGSNITIGSSSITITCDTDDAIASISFIDETGEVKLLGSGVVDQGAAKIVFENPLSITNELVVALTAYNKVTYLGTLEPVYGDDPFVVINSFTTTSAPNYGEAIGLNIELKNLAQEPYRVTNVSGIISSESSFVDIIDNSFTLGDLEPNEQTLLSSIFDIAIANNVPDQTPITFNLTLFGEYEEKAYVWTQTISIVANAPIISIGEITIDDMGEGLPGILDPGETANARIQISNLGHANSPTANIILSSLSEYVTINGEASIWVEPFATGEVRNVSFSISASTYTPSETSANLNIVVEAGEFEAIKELEIIVGHIPEYYMQNTTITACIGKFYDSGGPDDNYINNEAYTITINPLYEGNNIKVIFESFDVEQNVGCTWDYLMVFDGPNTSSPLLAKLCGTETPGPFSATTGPLTFYFYSDGYVANSGWSATFSCANAVQEVTFIVTDEDSQPIEGAIVKVGENESATNIEGKAVFEANSNQQLNWEVIKEGFQPATGSVDLLDEPIEVSVVMNTGVDVSFSVKNTQSNPVVGAEIDLEGYGSLVTDELGSATFTGVYNGNDIPFAINHSETHVYEGTINVNNEDINVEITMIPLSSLTIQSISPNVFPNPFTDFITIVNAVGLVGIEIVNIIGQQVIMQNIIENREVVINTKNLRPGVYLVKLVSINGEVFLSKMIKSH